MYIFPDLMKTTNNTLSSRSTAPADGLVARADTGKGALAALGAQGGLAAYEALSWEKPPPAWRPAVGEQVVITQLDARR